MKHTTSIIKLFSLALFVLVGTACIDNFDKINQKDYQVDKEELGREGYNVGASLKGLQQTGRKHLSLILSHVLTRSIVTCSTKQKIRSH